MSYEAALAQLDTTATNILDYDYLFSDTVESSTPTVVPDNTTGKPAKRKRKSRPNKRKERKPAPEIKRPNLFEAAIEVQNIGEEEMEMEVDTEIKSEEKC